MIDADDEIKAVSRETLVRFSILFKKG